LLRVNQKYHRINQIIKKCKKENIDILHAHNRYFDFLAFLVSKIITIKRITSVHSKVYHKKWLSYKSPKLIAASNSVRNHLINNFNIPVGKIVVINNFIDDNKEFVFSIRDEGIGIEKEYFESLIVSAFLICEEISIGSGKKPIEVTAEVFPEFENLIICSSGSKVQFVLA